jgi:DNA-binding IclR family transcriptional regulator
VDEKNPTTRSMTAESLAVALKTFATTLSQHSARQSDLIGIFASALKELHAEVQRGRQRNRKLQARLDHTEVRLAELERVVAAMRRQGWVN